MSVFDFSGQWTGKSVGDPSGKLVLDLDCTPEGSTGFAYLFSPTVDVPSSLAEVQIKTSKSKFTLEVFPHPFDGRIGYILSKGELENHFPEVSYPTVVQIDFERKSKDILIVTWRSDIETFGHGELERCKLPKVSNLDGEGEVTSWEDFKNFATKLNFRDQIFRGQSKPYPLQTTFHRTSRKVLHYYLNNDIQILHRSVTGRTKHVFNLDRPADLGAIMNLAQHHGFPTPLLDWTYSPFVAAWFAYQSALVSKKVTNVVRIYALNRLGLMKFPQYQNITHAVPHTSLLETLAIDNDRAIPQQGILMLTNVQDIEAHIFGLEQCSGIPLLRAYDLPIDDARDALNNLAMMGITRSTMMPGIESICLDLKERLF